MLPSSAGIFKRWSADPLGVRGGLPGGPRESQEILKCSVGKTAILAHIFHYSGKRPNVVNVIGDSLGWILFQ